MWPTNLKGTVMLLMLIILNVSVWQDISDSSAPTRPPRPQPAFSGHHRHHRHSDIYVDSGLHSRH
ncbi:hypothetical protein ABZP36_021302, partial [Zizania latifolia]